MKIKFKVKYSKNRKSKRYQQILRTYIQSLKQEKNGIMPVYEIYYQERSTKIINVHNEEILNPNAQELKDYLLDEEELKETNHFYTPANIFLDKLISHINLLQLIRWLLENNNQDIFFFTIK
jgi:hypothetical protein